MSTVVSPARREQASNIVVAAVTSLVSMVVFAMAVAHPLAWLWNHTVVGVVSVASPFADGYWAQVVVVLGLLAVVRAVLGLATDSYAVAFGDLEGSFWRLVTAALSLWVALAAAWLLLEYVV